MLFGGSVFTIFAGIYYWFPKMTGRMYDERLGKLHFWLTFIGFNLTFFPMHYIGLQGMPRRVADYAHRFADINLFISIASFGLGASTLVFLYNMARSWSHGRARRGEPVARRSRSSGRSRSPPPIFNFDEIPQVVGNPYEYGVPGAKHAIFGAPRAGTGRGSTDGPLLVIANETAASQTLLDARTRRGRRRDDRVTVIAPVNEPTQGYVVYEDTRRASAGRRLEQDAEGPSRGGAHPRRASSSTPARCRPPKDALAQLEPPVDEIVVSTHGAERSGWMRRDVVEDIERAAGGIPVRHVVVEPARRRGERPRDREPDRPLGRALDRIRSGPRIARRAS